MLKLLKPFKYCYKLVLFLKIGFKLINNSYKKLIVKLATFNKKVQAQNNNNIIIRLS